MADDNVFPWLEPLTAFFAEIEDNFNKFLDQVAAVAPSELRDILFESKQSTMGRAIAADLLDVIPVLGDVSNLFRVRHAGTVGETRPRRVPRQTLDLLLGALPDPLGAVLDILTPSGSLTFLREERRVP